MVNQAQDMQDDGNAPGNALHAAASVPEPLTCRNDPELEAAVERILAATSGVWSIVARGTGGLPLFHDRLADRVFPSASLIKILIMAEAFRQTEEGRLSLADRLDAPADRIVPFGLLPLLRERSYSIWDLIVYMMTVSDNTATNLLIDRLGMASVNAFAERLGLSDTRLRRHMMDLEARRAHRENETSARDMARLLAGINAGRIVSASACQVMRQMMENERGTDGLRRCFPAEWPMMRKTGELEGIRHDLCIVQTPAGALLLGVLATELSDMREAERVTVALGELIIGHASGAQLNRHGGTPH